jgi:hypothetical protein
VNILQSVKKKKGVELLETERLNILIKTALEMFVFVVLFMTAARYRHKMEEHRTLLWLMKPINRKLGRLRARRT